MVAWSRFRTLLNWLPIVALLVWAGTAVGQDVATPLLRTAAFKGLSKPGDQRGPRSRDEWHHLR